MGMEILESQLGEAGYETWRLDKNFVAFKFLIPHGRFRGKTVDIALQAPNFPEIPPSGPHIKPHLLPITGGGGVHPFGGIHARNQPNADFQYWSRPFKSWKNSKMNVQEYLAFLRTLLDFE